LRDYRNIIEHAYSPANYFARVMKVARLVDLRSSPGKILSSGALHNMKMSLRLAWAMIISKRGYKQQFWKTVIYSMIFNWKAVPSVMMLGAFYDHLGSFSAFVVNQIDRQIAELQQGTWQAPELIAGE